MKQNKQSIKNTPEKTYHVQIHMSKIQAKSAVPILQIVFMV